MANILIGYNDDGTEIWGDDGTGEDTTYTADPVEDDTIYIDDDTIYTADPVEDDVEYTDDPTYEDFLGEDGSFDIGKFLSGLSGAGVGLTATGILGALAALTGKPGSTTFSSSQSSGTGGTSSGTQTQKAELPKWYTDLIEKEAKALPAKGYESFGKDFLSLPNNRKVAGYMNPYIEQVMNPGLRRQAEDQAAELQSMNAQRVSRGGFGSARADLLGNQMAERQGLARQEFIDKSYQSAFNNASGLAKDDLSRAFDDWKLLQAGGTGTTGQALADANILNILKPTATTTSTSSGTSTGTTTSGTAATNTGPDPNKLAGAANVIGTITASAYPQGLPKTTGT